MRDAILEKIDDFLAAQSGDPDALIGGIRAAFMQGGEKIKLLFEFNQDMIKCAMVIHVMAQKLIDIKEGIKAEQYVVVQSYLMNDLLMRLDEWYDHDDEVPPVAAEYWKSIKDIAFDECYNLIHTLNIKISARIHRDQD